MSGRTLAVLMWKHMVVRRRRYFHTTVEILAPLMFFGLLFIFRDAFHTKVPTALTSDAHDYKEQLPDTIPLSNINTPRKIFYYPPNVLTDELMDEVGRRLHINRLKIMPYPNSKVKGYYGVYNLTDMSELMEDMGLNDAFIVYENIQEDGWPSHLMYSIRMKNQFLTNSYQPTDKMTRPHRQYGEVYEEFVRLQWAIDTSYITVTTGNNVTRNVTIQEFPYYGNDVRTEMVLLCITCSAFSIFSLFILFVFQMARLLEEKATGIQELIKMVGVSSDMLSVSHFLNVLPIGIIYSAVTTLFLKTTSLALIPNTNGIILFLMFFLHFFSVTSSAFAFSYLVQNTQYVTSISVFSYIVLWIPSRVLQEVSPPKGLLLLTGIFPHVPVKWFWDEVATFEIYGEGLNWSDITTSHAENAGPVLAALAWLVLQMILFFFLAWYLARVRPGKYGVALPWNFLCQRQYWTKNEVNPASVADEEELIVRDEKYFEPPPSNLEIGIKIDNVSKVFPKHKALSNVNLDVYKGEITVLLGHNGAGKTTLMSIITGMLKPTEGRVFVNGEDITLNRKKVSKHIGLCPQHNLYFPDLTVLEHVMFFALLKSGSYGSVGVSARSLVARLGLAEKAGARGADLSGGMQRRLQLALALAGGADVLVLDEPTAGLDVETRRSLWDLLLSLRGNHAVLISTHFMEEADALGDRIAALHLGRLRLHATTMHLKKAIGTGYRLHLTTTSMPLDDAITSVVTSQIPEASLLQKSINTLTYNLPATTSNKFPSLFTALEEKKPQLQIESIGVGVSTLEEVFLKLCSDTDMSKIEDEVDATVQEATFKKVTGIKLYLRQFRVLMKRQINFFLFKKSNFLILQLIIPIGVMMAFTYACNMASESEDFNAKLATDLDMYKRMSNPKVLYNIQNDEIVQQLKKDYPHIEFVEASDISDAVLRTGKQDTMEYNKYLVGIELNDTDAKVLYTTVVRHAAAAGMHALTGALAALAAGGDSTRRLTTYNHPVAGAAALQLDADLLQPKGVELSNMWAILIVFIILSTVTNLASLACSERASGTRHLHLLCGCSAALHWAATLLVHVSLTFVTLVLAAALAPLIFEHDNTINQPHFILCMIVVLTLGSLAFLASMYLVTFIFSERGTAGVLIACLIIFGLVTPLTQEVLKMTKDDEYKALKVLVEASKWTAPPHGVTSALLKAVAVARLNAYCTLNRQRCPNLFVPENGFDTATCCAGEVPRCYFCWDDYSPSPEMLPLVVQFFAYMVLVILIQEGVVSRVWELVINKWYVPLPAPEADEAVRAEKEYVDKLDKKHLENSNVAMLVQNLHKNYFGLTYRCNAVKGVSFSVKKGECFGLLGVNGAGKSTTFKMITAEVCSTRGTVYANGYHLDKDRSKYMRTLGYCPQFFGLDNFQTGEENLELLMTLRGLNAADVESEVNTWISIVGLEKFRGRLVRGYSGGMQRRLGAAGALAGGAGAALLDEPTAGVDVAARRRVWAALRRRLRARPVLLSSHSMDEMEALCDRLAVLAAGGLRALGSPHDLRAAHAAGHAVLLKLRPERANLHADEVDGPTKDVLNLKTTLQNKFNCTLKDEHKTMLHYHINNTMQYSTLFSELEALKAAFPNLIEDYSVTETTLEEVFLSFAKENYEEWRNLIV